MLCVFDAPAQILAVLARGLERSLVHIQDLAVRAIAGRVHRKLIAVVDRELGRVRQGLHRRSRLAGALPDEARGVLAQEADRIAVGLA